MNHSDNKQNPKLQPAIDTALACLTEVAKLLGIPAEVEQLRRAYVVDGPKMDEVSFIRAAQDLGLKTKIVSLADPAAVLPTPFVVRMKNDTYLLILKMEGRRAIVRDQHHAGIGTVEWEKLIAHSSGLGILVGKRLSQSATQEGKFSLRWFIPVILRHKKMLGQVMFFSFIIQLFGLVTPIFTQMIIDKVLVHRSIHTLDIILLGMIIVTTFQAWMTGLRSYLFLHTSSRIDAILGNRLYRHITALPMSFFESWKVGDVVSRVRELENIRRFITGSAITGVLDAVFAVVYICAMLFYSVKLSLLVFAAIPLFVILNLVYSPLMRRRYQEKFTAGTDVQRFLIESVTGINTVKAMAIERRLLEQWENKLAGYLKVSFRTNNLANVAGNLGKFIQLLANAGILWLGANSVMAGELTVGALVSFQMMSVQAIGPIVRIAGMWQQFQQTRVSVDRLGDILNSDREPAFNPNRTTLPAVKGEVWFERVTFRYRNDGAETLKEIDFKIPAGRRIGIVGASGSGKSTLAKLMQRLYVPEAGRVMIDGVDLSQVEPAWLRRQIGVVLQDNLLFNGTIYDNIAVGRPDAPPEAIYNASTKAGAHEFIQALPDGYKTTVGERGAALSGGQRQRIAIARALLHEPPILIFDEATSALDYEAEAAVMKNLDKIAEGRTMILIAHRLSTVRKCDVLLVLERGRLVEAGAHEELLARKGYYYRMYAEQYG